MHTIIGVLDKTST